jgi:hypothetical protein
VRHAEGSPTFRSHAAPTTKGCSTHDGGGEPCTPPRGSPREGVRAPSLRVSRPTRYTVTASTILGATDGGPVTPLRKRRGGELWPSSPHLLAGLRLTAETVTMVSCGSLPASPGRERLSHAARFERSRAGSGGQRSGTGSSREPSRRRGARIGRSRSCSRVISSSLQKSSDSVRRREADALHFTRSGSVQGRAPSPRPLVREHAVATGEETLAHPRSGNLT